MPESVAGYPVRKGGFKELGISDFPNFRTPVPLNFTDRGQETAETAATFSD